MLRRSTLFRKKAKTINLESVLLSTDTGPGSKHILESDDPEPNIDSNWSWPFCQQFTSLRYDKTLGLPNKRNPIKSSQVFANMPFTYDTFKLTQSGGDSSPFKINETVKKLGYEYDAEKNYVMLNELLLRTIGDAIKEELFSISKAEKTIDLVAHKFLAVCGFDENPFKIAAEANTIVPLFSELTKAESDAYGVMTSNDDLVLVFRCKAADGPLAGIGWCGGYLGQVTFDMLRTLCKNANFKGTVRNVFAIRVINYEVTMFRINPSRKILDTFIATKQIPHPKLELMCNIKDPVNNRGLSLLDPKQRKEAVRIMTNIRQFIIEEEKEKSSRKK
jgi:hypothetical protein